MASTCGARRRGRRGARWRDAGQLHHERRPAQSLGRRAERRRLCHHLGPGRDGGGTGVFAQQFDASGNPVGGANTWTGTAGNDIYTAPTSGDWTMSGLGASARSPASTATTRSTAATATTRWPAATATTRSTAAMATDLVLGGANSGTANHLPGGAGTDTRDLSSGPFRATVAGGDHAAGRLHHLGLREPSRHRGLRRQPDRRRRRQHDQAATAATTRSAGPTATTP